VSEQSSGTIPGDDGNGSGTVGDKGSAIDPASIAPTADAPAGRGGWPKGKPRGTKPAAGGGTAGPAPAGKPAGKTAPQKELALSTDGISALLIGIHTGIVALTKNSVWEIQTQEAEALAKATANVARHYPSLAGHEKLADWAMLIQALAVTYGTRIYLSIPDKPKEKPAPKPAPSNVAPFRDGMAVVAD
jgi:hypothetical protein